MNNQPLRRSFWHDGPSWYTHNHTIMKFLTITSNKTCCKERKQKRSMVWSVFFISFLAPNLVPWPKCCLDFFLSKSHSVHLLFAASVLVFLALLNLSRLIHNYRMCFLTILLPDPLFLTSFPPKYLAIHLYLPVCFGLFIFLLTCDLVYLSWQEVCLPLWRSWQGKLAARDNTEYWSFFCISFQETGARFLLGKKSWW